MGFVRAIAGRKWTAAMHEGISMQEAALWTNKQRAIADSRLSAAKDNLPSRGRLILNDIQSMIQTLNSQNVPMEDRYFVVSPRQKAALLNEAGLLNAAITVPMQKKSKPIDEFRIYGMRICIDPTHHGTTVKMMNAKPIDRLHIKGISNSSEGAVQIRYRQ